MQVAVQCTGGSYALTHALTHNILTNTTPISRVIFRVFFPCSFIYMMMNISNNFELGAVQSKVGHKFCVLRNGTLRKLRLEFNRE